MNWKKSVVAFIVFISMVAGSIPAKGIITNLMNTPTPNQAGTNASQRIRFLNTVSVPIGGRIEITFPAAFNLSSGGDWVPADITLNLQNPATVSDVLLDGKKLSFGIATQPSGTGFQEINLAGTRIINPAAPGMYTISLTTYDTVANSRRILENSTSSQFEIVSNMTAAAVIPEPNIAGALAKYTIRFKLGSGSSRSLFTGDRIKIAFDANLVSPANATTVPGTITKDCVTVNGMQPTVDPIIDFSGSPGVSKGVVQIVVPQNINSPSTSGADITIVFNICAGILNPSGIPWERRATISTLRSNGTSIIEGPIDTNLYTIRTSLSSPKVMVRPDQVSQNAEYHLIIPIGNNGELIANSGRIDIQFPDGTTVPSSVSSTSIHIAVSPTEPAFPCTGVSTVAYDPQVTGNKVSFVVPFSVASNSFICLYFSTLAGIINPAAAGNYYLKISTSAEPTIVSSAPYYIKTPGRSSVFLVTNKSREITEYQIHASVGVNGSLYPFGTGGIDKYIMITFPAGFVLPASIAAGSIKVNNISTSDPAIITGQKITFPTPVVIENNSEITIVILKQAGIQNPQITESPQFYNLIIETDKEKDANRIISDQFKIETWITDLNVFVQDPGTSTVSRYEITFTTGDVDDNLKPNATIFFEFPDGTIIPPFISTGNIRFTNDAGPSVASILVTGQKVALTLPPLFTIPQLTPVKVIFLPSCGIRNPDVPGAYRIIGYTSVEPIPQSSNLYTIGSIAGNVQVKVEPNITSYCSSADGAKYTVRFTTGVTGGLTNGQNVYVVFPPEYTAGYLPIPVIPAGRITVNGILTMLNASVTIAPASFPAGSHLVSIPLPLSIDKSSTIEISFLPSANVDNPIVSITPQPFYLSIYTDSEPSPINGIYYIVSAISGLSAGCNVPVGVTLTKQAAGSSTGMNIQFKTGPVGSLTAGNDKIFIRFPEGTRIPNFVSGTYITMNVGVDNFATSIGVSNPFITNQVMSFNVPFGLPPIGSNTPVYVYITQSAGVVNPPTPGNYHIAVSTSQEMTEINSIDYTITYVGTTRPSVVVYPPFVNLEASYTIKFYTGSYGGINIGDPINIIFPAGTVIPDSTVNPIVPQYVSVNGSPCTINIDSDPITRQVTIYSPAMVAGNSSVNIVFTKEAKIKNPLAPNSQYTLSVWSLREGSQANPFISNYYEIMTANRPTSSTVTIDPCTPFTNAQYIFTFYTPVSLTADVDSFDITFPSGTFIPSTISANTILVGTQECRTNPIVTLYTVRIFPPAGISSDVMITFKTDAGLQNPAAGSYTTDIRITAPGGGGSTGSASYFVCADLDFSRLEILPAGARIQIGKSQVFMARTYDTNGIKMDFGVNYRWTVNGGIGIFDNVRVQSPEFYARNMGSGNISVIATYGNKSISASVNIVVLGSIEKVVLTPNQVTTSRGKKTHFIVQSYDINDEVLDYVQYDWSLAPTLGKITKIGTGAEIEFLAEVEGTCILDVTATQSAVVKSESATIVIKNGVNSLKFQPESKTDSSQPSELIGPFTIQLVNEGGMNYTTNNQVIIQLISSSLSTRFSTDGITWSKGNTQFVDVSPNFSESLPFYISELEPNNISIIASSMDYNSTVLPLSIRGSKKSLNIATPPQTLRISKPSAPIKIQFIDIMGNPYALKNDAILTLHSNSETGTFSKQVDPWIPTKTCSVSKNNSSVELYYMDNREGTYSLTFSSALFGSVSQMISIASPGAVSTPEVTVTPSINSLQAEYNIKFTIGIDGELRMFSDTITIQFPDGTGIPVTLTSGDISVNGLTLLHAPLINADKFKVTMEAPMNLSPGTSVEIIIRNIINPSLVGEYNLQVNTSTQPSPSTSKPYRIDVSTVSNVLVTTNPIIISTIAEYQIQFKTGLKGSLLYGDSIFLMFDYATSLPKEIKKENVLINGFSLDKDPQINGKIIAIAAQREYPANYQITIVFKTECEIKNPAYAGTYTLKVFTIKEQAMVESEPYEIVQNSVIKNLKIKPRPATVTSNGEYTVEFSVGPYGALTEDDFIYLVLSDMMLPKTMNPISISVNNVRLTKNVTISDKTLKIPVPQFINNNSSVIIVIYRGAGIINPGRPGNDYRISAFTSKENLPIMSETYTIEPAVIINYILSPSEPDGLNNWYRTVPKLLFSTNVAGTIFFRIDSEQEQIYTEPVSLVSDGFHEITYRCVSTLGSESDIQSFTYKFDGEGPIIETNLKDDTLYTKSDIFALTLRIRDISIVKVTLNDKDISLIENSFSTMLNLKEGENLVMIRASDEAGNMTTLYKKIIVKKNPPILLVTSPALFQLVENVYFVTGVNGSELYANIRFAGSAELGIDSLKIVSQTTGFMTEIQVDFMGTFDRSIGVKSMAGDNVISITAVDKVGNETKIVVSYIVKTVLRLRIGIATAYLNGNPIQLEVKPYLKYNLYTMVPFRLIAESLGANIVWDAAARRVTYDFRGIHVELTIGSKKAIVSDATGKTRNVLLQAESELKGGRTQVPLRFVSEALGAKVGWDGKLWEASVSYPYSQ